MRDDRSIEQAIADEHLLAADLENYEGKWVALSMSRVIASADTLSELLRHDLPDDAVLHLVPPAGLCFFAAAGGSSA